MFTDRAEAGKLLAEKILSTKSAWLAGIPSEKAGRAGRSGLSAKRPQSHTAPVLVLAIPRGGLVIGGIIAKMLHIPLDVILTKKIGYPGEPEAAIGAVSMQGYTLRESFAAPGMVPKEYLTSEVRRIQQMLRQRYGEYMGSRKPLRVKGRVIVLTDDGVATGSTMLAAIKLLRKEKPLAIIVAVPVAPAEAVSALREKSDIVICLHEEPSAPFFSIGSFYRDFRQVSDEEAKMILSKNKLNFTEI